jgi:hypothetical protein
MGMNPDAPILSLDQLRQMSKPMESPSVNAGEDLEVAGSQPSLGLDELRKMSADADPLGGIKAGAAAVARGASFGLSDVALTQSGLVRPETLKSLEDAYPTTSLVGELAPIAASLIPTGGASLLAGGVKGVSAVGRKVAEATAKKLVQEGTKSTAKNVLGRATAAGLGAAVEGGFYGAGQFISDAALGDPNANAEKFFSQVGLSSLIGGGFGATFNIAGQGLKAAANNYKSVAKSAFSKINQLDDEVIDYVVKNNDKLDEIFAAPGSKEEKIRQSVVTSLDDYFSKYKQFSDDFGTNFRDTITKLDTSNRSIPLKNVIEVLDEQITSLTGASGLGAPSAKKAAASLGKYKDDLILAATQNSSNANLADDLLQQFKNFKGSKKEYKQLISKIASDPKQAGKLFLKPSDLVAISRSANEEAANLGLYSWRIDTKPGAFQWSQIGQKARSLLGDIDESSVIKEWNKRYSNLATARSELKKFGFKGDLESLPKFEDKMVSLFSRGSKQAKDAKRWLKVIDEDLGTNLVDSQDLLTAYDKLTSGKFAAIATGYSTLLPALSAVTGLSLGLPAPVIGAATLGAAALQAPILRRPIIKGATAAAPIIDKGIALTTKAGQSVPQALVPFIAAKSAGLAFVDGKVKKTNEETSGALKNYLNNPSQFKIETRAPKTKETYLKTLEDYIELISDDVKFNEYMDEQFEDLGLVYPSIIEPLKGKTKQSLSYLVDGAPKPVESASIFDDPQEPSDQQIGEFKQRLEVVEDPRVVLKSLKNGTLSQNQVETLKEIYPVIYEGMRTAFIEDVSKVKSNLSYNEKLQMSLLFDVEGIPALRNETFLLLQSTFAQENQPNQQRSSGRLDRVATSNLTESQRLLGG